MTDLIRTMPMDFRLDRLEIESVPASVRRRIAAKRAIDVIVSFLGLVVILPVLAVVALLVRITSPGPALFRQTRVGAGGRRFKVLKFRTMVCDAEERLAADPDLRRLHEANDFKLPVELDPRVTAIGRVLRRMSLDELPQLFNVLRGDMSLVGARPIEPAQVPLLYGARQGLYLRMRPGLTGYWQVNGRSAVTDEARAELDLHYLRNWNLKLDAQIMLRTLPAILTRHGAY
jgi:lipopolysaccharide/colanic/teichoic acid biosynthesis glycosyltransferase